MRVSEGPDTFEFRSAHGMKAAHSRLRTFADIAVRHLQHFNHPGRAWHDLSGPQDTLTVVLSEIGGRCEARTNLRSPAAPDRNRRAVECARLLAAECDASDPSAGLYGEGLMIALLSACFQGRSRKEKSGLSASQLRLVLDYIHENLDASVSLIELARLVGLSSSQFARLFKASTGVSPHRYQLNTRIGKAQELLLVKGEGLSTVAAATGFADQSHFTRAFKRVIGATPREWRQDRTR